MNTENAFNDSEYVHVTTRYLSLSILKVLVQNMPDSRKLMIHASEIEEGFENPYLNVQVENI